MKVKVFESDPTRLSVGPFRLSYAHLDKPWAAKGDTKDPAYSTEVLIPKEEKEVLQALGEAYKAAVAAKFGASAPKGLRKPWIDGDLPKQNGEERGEASKGHYILKVKTKSRVPYLDRRGKAIAPEELYSGCWAMVSLKLYGYDTAGNAGVGAFLNAVMKDRDGERLGGGEASDPMAAFEGMGSPAPAGSGNPFSDDDDV